MKGVKFHDDYARIINKGIKAEMAFDDENLLLAIANNINHLHRSIGASMDLSGIGINGLLMSYRYPASTGLTMKHAFKALGDKDVLNRFFADHDKLAKQTGNLTVDEMVGEGLHLAGEGEFAGGTFSYTCNTSARFDYDLPDFQAQPDDVNQDHAHDISDPMAILRELFLGDSMTCRAACDVNSDSDIDLSDAVYMLNYLFFGSPALPEDPVDCTSGDAA